MLLLFLFPRKQKMNRTKEPPQGQPRPSLLCSCVFGTSFLPEGDAGPASQHKSW